MSLEEPDRAETEHADPEINGIIERAAGGGLAVAEEIRERLRELVRSKLTPHEFLSQAERIFEEYAPFLEQTISDALLAAWLSGANGVAHGVPTPQVQGVPGAPPPPPAPPLTLPSPEQEPVVHFPMIERAAESLAEKRLLLRRDFDQLSDSARRTAFTAAKVVSLDTLEKMRDSLVTDIAEGGTLGEFRENVDSILGQSALSPAHVENIYRTNVALAYADGQRDMLRHPLVATEFPYVEYHAVHDERTRPEHLAMEKHGIGGSNIYRADDPVIKRFWPPWSWQCRCHPVPLSIEDAAAKGIKEAQIWEETGLPPANPKFVEPPPFDPPEGWRSGVL